MGNKAIRTGVNKQCTAQIIDMLMAKESNHPCPRPLLALVEHSIERRKDNKYFYSVNRECRYHKAFGFISFSPPENSLSPFAEGIRFYSKLCFFNKGFNAVDHAKYPCLLRCSKSLSKRD